MKHDVTGQVCRHRHTYTRERDDIMNVSRNILRIPAAL